MSSYFQTTGDIFGKHVRLATAIAEWNTLGGHVDKQATSNKLVVIFRAPQGITVKPFPLVFKGDLTPDNAYLSPEDMDVFAENRDAVKRLRHRQVHETKTNHTSAKQNAPQNKGKQPGLAWLLDKLPIIQSLLGTTINYGEAKLSTEHQIVKLLPSELPKISNQEFPEIVVSDTSDDAPNKTQGDIPGDDQPSLPKEKEEKLEKVNPANRTQILDTGSHESSNARSIADPEIEDASNDPEPQASDQLASGETVVLAPSTAVANNESLEASIEEEGQQSPQSEMNISSGGTEKPLITNSDVEQQTVNKSTNSPIMEDVQEINAPSEPSSLLTSENQPTPAVVGDLFSPPKQRKQLRTNDPSESITSPEEEAISIDDQASSPPVQPTTSRGVTVNPPTTPSQKEIVGAPDSSETLKVSEKDSEDTAVSSLSKESSRRQDDKPFVPGEEANTPSHKSDPTPNPIKEEQPVNPLSNPRPKPHNKNDFESLDPSETLAEIFVIDIISVNSSKDELTGLQPEDARLLPEESGQKSWYNDLILSNPRSHSSPTANRSLDDGLSYDWHQLEQENGLITTPPSFPSIEGYQYHIGSSEGSGENCFDKSKNPDPCNLPNPGDSLDLNNINEL